MRAQEELEEPQEAMFATTFPTEHEFGLKNRSVPPTPTPILRGWTQGWPSALSPLHHPPHSACLSLTRTTITEVPSQVALRAAEWEPVQPGAEVVNIPRRWQERSRALLGSTEHGRGVGLCSSKTQRKNPGEFGPLLGDEAQPEGAGP